MPPPLSSDPCPSPKYDRYDPPPESRVKSDFGSAFRAAALRGAVCNRLCVYRCARASQEYQDRLSHPERLFLRNYVISRISLSYFTLLLYPLLRASPANRRFAYPRIQEFLSFFVVSLFGSVIPSAPHSFQHDHAIHR
jgi:hypothetical protein